MARTVHLHRVPLLAARGPDAATVQRVGSRTRQEVHGLGDRNSRC
jgi:hypothetical protein